MAGNSEGAKKAAQTARERHGKDFHAKAASKSWSNPNRSRRVGFATMDPDTHKTISAKGGKNKHEATLLPEAATDSSSVRILPGTVHEEHGPTQVSTQE